MQNPSDNFKELRRSLLIGILFGIIMAVVFFAGFLLRDFVDVPPVFAATSEAEEGNTGYDLLDEVQQLIDDHYLHEQPDYVTRQYAAIRGMLSSLDDRNTFFIEPAVAQSESDVLAGTYGGIGVNLSRNAAGEFVIFPFPDGPAANAGLLDNDVIVQIGDYVMLNTEQQDVVDQMLRGEVRDNDGVEITVSREDREDTVTVFVPFDVINIPSILWRVLPEDSRIGYIQIMRFTNRTPDEFLAAVDGLTSENIEAVVIDLRHNGGGLLRESIEIAGNFLDGLVVLYEVTVEGEQVFEAESGGQLLDLPLVVLVNGGTASAAELVAGALQDHDRGILIGQTTYGKGTIQQIFSLSDSSSIHVTSAEWFTPDRHRIDSVGLEPDIMMIPDENGRDIEIGEAIIYLQRLLEDAEN